MNRLPIVISATLLVACSGEPKITLSPMPEAAESYTSQSGNEIGFVIEDPYPSIRALEHYATNLGPSWRSCGLASAGWSTFLSEARQPPVCISQYFEYLYNQEDRESVMVGMRYEYAQENGTCGAPSNTRQEVTVIYYPGEWENFVAKLAGRGC